MARTFLISSDFMGKAGEFAIGCAAVATGMVVAPVAGPAIGLAAIFGSAWLKTLIRDRPDCEQAVTAIRKSVSREFPAAQDADETQVRAAEKALAKALASDGLFGADALREAWARSDRLAESMTALTLEGVVSSDPSFAAPSLRHDFARDVLERVFVAAAACPAFQGQAILTGVETAIGEVRGVRNDVTDADARAEARHQELIEVLVGGRDDPAFRKLRSELDSRMDELGILQVERSAWLANWVDEVVAAFREKSQPTNEGAGFDALREKALELLLSDPAEAASPFLKQLELDEVKERERQEERQQKRDRLWDEAVEMDMLALRFDAAVANLWKQAEEMSPEGENLRWMFERAVRLGQHGSEQSGSTYLILAETAFKSLISSISRESMAYQWAMAHNNLGICLRNRGEREAGDLGRKALSDAISCHKEAIAVQQKSGWQKESAASQSNLGINLKIFGERIGGAKGKSYILEAVENFNLALKLQSPHEDAESWCGTKNNLGNALIALARLSAGSEAAGFVKRAVSEFESGLKFCSKDQSPTQWATLQNNLGNALSDRALAGDAWNLDLLNQSIAAYEAASEVWNVREYPSRWASNQNNIGSSLAQIAETISGAEGAEIFSKAIVRFELALKVFTFDQMRLDWAQVYSNICMARGNKALCERDRDAACKAASDMRKVVAVMEECGELQVQQACEKVRAVVARFCRELGGTCAD